MATKLKNLIRHWFTKTIIFISIFVIGQLLIWNTMNYFESHKDFSLDPSYEYSTQYYQDFNRFYQDVYNAYYGRSVIDQNEVNELNLHKGFYYLIQKSSGAMTSNVPSLVTSSDFYNLVYSIRSVSKDSYFSTDSGNNMRLHPAPINTDTVSVGITQEQYMKNAEAYGSNWRQTHGRFIIYALSSLLFMSFMVILLLTVAGKKPNSEDIHLDALDYFFIDVYWLAGGFGIALILSLTLNAISSSSTHLSTYLLIGACTIIGLIVLQGLLSISKRIKNRSLFKHTLIYWILNGIFGALARLTARLIRETKDGPLPLWSFVISAGFMALTVFCFALSLLMVALFNVFGLFIALPSALFPFALLGLYLNSQDRQLDQIVTGVDRIASGNLSYKLPEGKTRQFERLSEQINRISEGFLNAVQTEVKAERMRSELITNVSHDIRTPLTSIISYVELLKNKDLNSEEAQQYIEILDQKSQRLKSLTEDLFEASKATSGTLQVNIEHLSLQSFIVQATGEYQERFEEKQLELRIQMKNEPIVVATDSRHLWRIVDNLLSNIYKYAAPKSRVYLDVNHNDSKAFICMKNISDIPLNVPVEELLERFTRGDSSRNTEGSGLGLSIANSLTTLINGSFDVITDGDLFKVTISLPCPLKTQ